MGFPIMLIRAWKWRGVLSQPQPVVPAHPVARYGGGVGSEGEVGGGDGSSSPAVSSHYPWQVDLLKTLIFQLLC